MQATARIVHDRGSVHFALPVHTTQEIVDHPAATAVPGSPAHAVGLLEWQGRHIPLIDVSALLGAATPRSQAARYALVLAMQEAPGAPIQHGAITLDSLPETIEVDDAHACDIPTSRTWRRVAIACFMRDGLPVPVVDTARLFA